MRREKYYIAADEKVRRVKLIKGIIWADRRYIFKSWRLLFAEFFRHRVEIRKKKCYHHLVERNQLIK